MIIKAVHNVHCCTLYSYYYSLIIRFSATRVVSCTTILVRTLYKIGYHSIYKLYVLYSILWGPWPDPRRPPASTENGTADQEETRLRFMYLQYYCRISVIKKTAKQLLCKSAEKVAVNRYSIQLILWSDILPCPADLIPRYPHLCS